MASMLPNTSSCCECGSALNITTFEAYLKSIGKTLEAIGFIYVEDLVALRDVATNDDNRLAHVEGYASQTDGIYQIYDWAPGNTDADDAGLTTVRPDDYDAAVGGTWKRRM